MSDINIDHFVSTASAIVAIISVAITFLVYRLAKLNLQKYEDEIDFLKKQSRSHALLETRSAIDHLNDKIVEWDLDLTDYADNENLTPSDKKIIVWIIHSINIAVYASVQKDILGEDYYHLIKRRTIFNVSKLVKGNKKAREYLYAVNRFTSNPEAQNNEIEQEYANYFDELIQEIQ